MPVIWQNSKCYVYYTHLYHLFITNRRSEGYPGKYKRKNNHDNNWNNINSSNSWLSVNYNPMCNLSNDLWTEIVNTDFEEGDMQWECGSEVRRPPSGYSWLLVVGKARASEVCFHVIYHGLFIYSLYLVNPSIPRQHQIYLNTAYSINYPAKNHKQAGIYYRTALDLNKPICMSCGSNE